MATRYFDWPGAGSRSWRPGGKGFIHTQVFLTTAEPDLPALSVWLQASV